MRQLWRSCVSNSKRQGKPKSRSSRSPKTQGQPASSKAGPSRVLNYRTVGGGGCLRPAVGLGLVDKGGNILPTKPLGIVDSGCDSTTFPIEWAEPLGVDPIADC